MSTLMFKYELNGALKTASKYVPLKKTYLSKLYVPG